MIWTLLWLVVTGISLADPPSPHGQPEGCAACHLPAASGASASEMQFTTGHPDGACRECHDRDPHQVGIVPNRVQVPQKMLLYGDKLSCMSCHDEPACEGETVSTANPNLFRGGPYASVGVLCSQCHVVTGVDRFNPHQAMAERDPSVCEHCHLEQPKETGAAPLKISGPNACLGCHVAAVHSGSEAHLVDAPPWALSGARKAGLPLDERGRIVCVTCHDPHPAASLGRGDRAVPGVALFPSRWVAEVLQAGIPEGTGAQDASLQSVVVEPDFLRRPLGNGALCQACHDPSHPAPGSSQ